MTAFASNANYVGPLPAAAADYEGEPTKVAMTEDERANGFVPELPVAAEHLNHELNQITSNIETLEGTTIPALIKAGLEGSALCNWKTESSGSANLLLHVLWNGTLFVAVGASGTIL